MQHDDRLVKDYGVKLATDMVKKLITGGIYGVNFCTLNLEKSVQLILEELQWAGHYDDHHSNKLINVSRPYSAGQTRIQSLLLPSRWTTTNPHRQKQT